MAKPVSLLELRIDAMNRADLAGSVYATVQAAELNKYVNKGAAKYYEELVKADEMYNVAQQTITVASATDPAAVFVNGVQQLDTYSLPPDFLATKGLEASLGGQQMLTGRRVEWRDRNIYKFWGTTGWFFGQALLYYLRDAFLIFVPTPQAAFAVTHWYTPTVATLVDDADTVDVLNGGDDFIALYAAMQLARKEESWEMYQALKGDLADEMVRVQSMAPKRDAAEPRRVTETARRSSVWRGSRL